MSEKVSDLLPNAKSGTEYAVHDLFSNSKVISTLKTTDTLTLSVAAKNGCRMVKLVPQSE